MVNLNAVFPGFSIFAGTRSMQFCLKNATGKKILVSHPAWIERGILTSVSDFFKFKLWQLAFNNPFLLFLQRNRTHEIHQLYMRFFSQVRPTYLPICTEYQLMQCMKPMTTCCGRCLVGALVRGQVIAHL